MKFLKGILDFNATAPTSLRKIFYYPIFRVLAIITITQFFTSCSDVDILDSDTYGNRWDNTYLWFKPGEMETIYVSKTADEKTATPVPNNGDYLIEWQSEGKIYTLKVTDYTQDIDLAWFTGYDAVDEYDEIPWVIKDNTIELTSENVLPAENGMYQVFLTDDKNN